jgi:PelA/Pel-15E family pectate lyase
VGFKRGEFVMRIRPTFVVAAAVFACAGAALAVEAPSLAGRPDAWFTSAEGRRTVDNIVSWQGHGPGGVQGWPKAYDAATTRPADGGKLEWGGIATIDNGATYSELRILARAISFEADAARKETLTASFNKGLDAVLAAQYPNGGWPQRFPPGQPGQAAYDKHITFNDNAMTRLLGELKDIGAGGAPYVFVDAGRREKAKAAFDKGIGCILKCQIVVDGKLTGWCAQHDEVTLKPAGGRAYELPSISGGESADIAVLLMGIASPDDRVKTAIEGAYAWYEAAKIEGKKSVAVTGADGKRDRVLQDSPGAVTWARFYDLETGKPFFSGRDGKKVWSMAEVEQERRTGYSWYGPWGERVEREYKKWKAGPGK